LLRSNPLRPLKIVEEMGFYLYGDPDWEQSPDWAGTHICILVEEESEAANLKRRHSRLKKRDGGSEAAPESP